MQAPPFPSSRMSGVLKCPMKRSRGNKSPCAREVLLVLQAQSMREIQLKKGTSAEALPLKSREKMEGSGAQAIPSFSAIFQRPTCNRVRAQHTDQFQTMPLPPPLPPLTPSACRASKNAAAKCLSATLCSV